MPMFWLRQRKTKGYRKYINGQKMHDRTVDLKFKM